MKFIHPTEENGGMVAMSDIEIANFKKYPDLLLGGIQALVNFGKSQNKDFRENDISDGYHTFAELYEFRMVYNAMLFNEWQATNIYHVHKSWRHEDGEWCFGKRGEWFIVSAMLPTGLISNHYKAEYWDLFQVKTVPKALFKFDGHNGEDVLKRMKGVITKNQ